MSNPTGDALSQNKSINSGPSIQRPKMTDSRDWDVSLRLITVYDLPTDGVLARFDILLNATEPRGSMNSWKGDQFNGSLLVGESFLLMPTSGITNELAFRANGKELSAILRGLADKIDENERKEKDDDPI